jgi:hypothetical protein
MKNKLITNDSYIRKLIKESIIFNTKKQSLAQALSDNFRMFENKFKGKCSFVCKRNESSMD